MSTKEARRNRRIPYSGSVRLSWEDPRGSRFALGRCIDISETGLRVELPVTIPMHTAVLLTAERIGLSGSASVKHLARFGAIEIPREHYLTKLAEALNREAIWPFF